METPTQISHIQTNYKQFQYQPLFVEPHSLEEAKNECIWQKYTKDINTNGMDGAEKVIHLVPDAITRRVNIYLVM